MNTQRLQKIALLGQDIIDEYRNDNIHIPEVTDFMIEILPREDMFTRLLRYEVVTPSTSHPTDDRIMDYFDLIRNEIVGADYTDLNIFQMFQTARRILEKYGEQIKGHPQKDGADGQETFQFTLRVGKNQIIKRLENEVG